VTAVLNNTNSTATRPDRRRLDELADLVGSRGLALVGALTVSEALTGRDQRLLAEAGLRFSRMLDRRSERWRARLLEVTDAAAPECLSRREVFAALGGHAVALEIDALVAQLVSEGRLEQLRGPASGGRRAVLVRRPSGTSLPA
jgi:hypothetical protein